MMVILQKGSELDMKPKRWIWKDWLAQGKLHILGGAPGTGKTTIAMDIAAILTGKQLLPDGDVAPQGDVVIWSGEDSPSDTLKPKLVLAGANLERVHFITGMMDDVDEERCFDPSKDIDALKEKVCSMPDVKLIIIDPIVSALIGDGHKNAEVRRSLRPIVEMAEEVDCAVLGITHFSKGTIGADPVERLTGSIALGALPRVVWVAARGKDETEEEKRILCIAKSNIGKDEAGFVYSIANTKLEGNEDVDATQIMWEKTLVGNAKENLASVEVQEEGALGEAMKFVQETLKDGPISSRQFKVDIEGAGHSEKTVQRAIKKLENQKVSVKRYKEGNAWFIKLEEMRKLEELTRPDKEEKQ